MASFHNQCYECYQSPLHGNGVRASVPIPEGDIIFHEKPLCCMQSLPNKQHAIVCSYCMRFLGSVEFQVSVLTKRITRQQGFNVDDNPECQFLSDIIPCSARCGEYYCSLECRDQHWNVCHKLLCTGYIMEDEADSHPLIKFKIFAVTSNEIFLLVADVFAMICIQVENLRSTGKSLEEASIVATSPFSNFVRNLWWDAAVAPQGSSQKVLNRTLQKLVNEAWSHLNEALGISARGLADILSPEYLSRTIGMFEQNNVGIRLSNPLGSMLTGLQENDSRIPFVKSVIDQVIENIDAIECCEVEEFDEMEQGDEDMDEMDGENEEDYEENDEDDSNENDENNAKVSSSASGSLQQVLEVVEEAGGIDVVFPPLDGTAFYDTICKINHSCAPNVIVQYTSDPERGLLAKLVALRNISPGEEFVQSYIDNKMSYRERQKALKDYGFACACSKCSAERFA